jgi:hypothetical protein
MLLLERGTVAGSPAYFLCERGEITPWYLTLVHQHFVIQ